MKKYISLFLLLAAHHAVSAQLPAGFSKSTKIYLVRHAEKEGGKDPALTVAGRQRAEDLYVLLKDKHIFRIYATPYRRTQMTGDSLRIKLSIDTTIYAADTLGTDLIQKISRHNDFDKTLLIIGHSNTIPALIRHLGVTDFDIKELAETEFDNIFLISYKKGKAVVRKMKYGAASTISATMQ